jgi:hypothetical protein
MNATSRCDPAVDTVPGINTSVPFSATLNWAVPVLVPARATPSITGTGPPTIASRRRSNLTAKTTPP